MNEKQTEQLHEFIASLSLEDKLIVSTMLSQYAQLEMDAITEDLNNKLMVLDNATK